MYKDLKATFWWTGMKTDVADYVASCLVCQKVKIEHQRPGGTLDPIDIPQWKWDSISMDFVTHLPRSVRGHDSIWVIVDRLTKCAHFLQLIRRCLWTNWQNCMGCLRVLYQTKTWGSHRGFGSHCRKLWALKWVWAQLITLRQMVSLRGVFSHWKIY